MEAFLNLLREEHSLLLALCFMLTFVLAYYTLRYVLYAPGRRRVFLAAYRQALLRVGFEMPRLPGGVFTQADFACRLAALDAALLQQQVDQRLQAHLKVLRRKREQLLHTDDYGVLITRRWEKELKYFLQKVIFPLDLTAFEHLGVTRRETFAALSNLEDPQVIRGWAEHIDAAISAAAERMDWRYGAEEVNFDTMTGLQYEEFVAVLIRRLGWQAQVTQSSGDNGADIIAESEGRRVAVQCKFFSSPVGNKSVQEAFSAKTFYDCHYACVVSNATFTLAARKAAEKLQVSLLHHDDLDEYFGP